MCLEDLKLSASRYSRSPQTSGTGDISVRPDSRRVAIIFGMFPLAADHWAAISAAPVHSLTRLIGSITSDSPTITFDISNIGSLIYGDFTLHCATADPLAITEILLDEDLSAGY
jgi:hypothetical protein